MYIEGDNLEVLKLLQKSYYGRIGAIYIDPPYNTGNDFLYSDDYRDNLDNYLKKDKDGFDITSNPETGGKFHTNWLNMMYPRLKLARNLLADDGIIFISIDDNEMSNLKKICDEIFGEENFIETFLWNKSSGGSSLSKFSRKDYEYIICYSKNLRKIGFEFKGSISKGMGDSSMINKPNKYSKLKFPPNSIYFINNVSGNIDKFKDNDLELHNDIKINNSYNVNEVEISAKWKWSQEYLNKQLDNNTKIISKTNKLRLRYIKDNSGSIIAPTKSISEKDGVGFTVSGSSEINSLLGKGCFDYPKPTNLIEYLLDMILINDSIVLDFFSGSGTTGHAIFNINLKNKAKHSFILVQIPEKCDINSEAYKEGYKNICEIGKQRIRRAGDKIVEESGNKDLDIGFKVFKLDSSNLEKWDPDYDDLKQTLLVQKDNIKEGRTEEDLVYEVMLKYGIDLSVPVEEVSLDNGSIFSVGYGSLVISLDSNITKELAIDIINYLEELGSENSRVVFRDKNFKSDSDKTNIKEILKINNVAEFITI